MGEAWPEERRARVWELHVRTGSRRMGIGRALMERVLDRARQDRLGLVMLETQNTNVSAVENSAKSNDGAADIIARVGGEIITFSELNTMLNSSAMVGLSIPALGTRDRNEVIITLPITGVIGEYRLPVCNLDLTLIEKIFFRCHRHSVHEILKKLRLAVCHFYRTV